MAWRATRKPQGTYYMAGKEHLIEKNEEKLGLPWQGRQLQPACFPEQKSRKVLPQLLYPLPRIGLYFKDCPAKDE